MKLDIISILKEHNKSVVFRSMFKSVAIAILLPIVVAIVIAMTALSMVEKRKDSMEDAMKERLMSEVEEKFLEARRVSAYIKKNKLITNYALSSRRDYWKEHEIQTFLMETVAGHSDIDLIYLYLPQYDCVISNQNGVETKRFHEAYVGGSYEEWINSLKGRWIGSLEITRNKSYYAIDEHSNSIVSTVRDMGIGDEPSVLVVLLKSLYLKDIMRQRLPEKGMEVLIHDNKRIISGTVEELYENGLWEDVLKGEKNAKQIKIGETVYGIEKKNSSRYGFSFLFLKKKSILGTMMTITEAYGLIAIMLCVFLSLFICLKVAYSNYKPVGRLLALLEGERIEGIDEYVQIETSVRKYIQSNTDLTITLNRYMEALREVYLEKILLGKISYTDGVNEISNLYNLNFEHPFFAMILINIHEQDIDKENLYLDELQGIEALKQVLKAYVSTGKTNYVLKENEYFVGILNGGDADAEAFRENILYEAKQLKEYFKEKEEIDCEIYISSIFEELGELNKIYEKLEKELETEITKQEKNEKSSDFSENKCLSIDYVLDTIKEKVFSDGFSVSGVADNLNITPAYLSRFFKGQMGMGVLDYVQRFRIARVKELIREDSKITIKDLAVATGFYNDVALIRVFKKYEGMTPKQFKDNLNKGK